MLLIFYFRGRKLINRKKLCGMYHSTSQKSFLNLANRKNDVWSEIPKCSLIEASILPVRGTQLWLRPDLRNCVDKVLALMWLLDLLPFGVSAPIQNPRLRLVNFSVYSEDPSNSFHCSFMKRYWFGLKP